MQRLALHSNGKYHVVVTEAGTGFSRWGGLAVTRWRDDVVLDEAGTFLYLRDDEGGRVWSAMARLTQPSSAVPIDGAKAGFLRREGDIETCVEVAVAPTDDVELRRLRITNLSARKRTLSATSFAEIVLAPAATDSAHLAFSKLFVETEIDTELGAILASRRRLRQPAAVGDAS